MKRFSIMRAVAGLLATAMACLALLGWGLDQPFLAAFGGSRIPMAPSTALLFILFGSAFFLREARPASDMAYRISRDLVLLGTFAALALFLSSLLGLSFPIEHLGLNFSQSYPSLTIGHISPASALSFIVAGLSFILIPRPGRVEAPGSLLSLALAYLLLSSCFVFLLGYLFGSPWLYGGKLIPPALTTNLSFSSLGVYLALSAPGRPAQVAGAFGSRVGRNFLVPSLIFFAVGSITAAYLYYRGYEEKIHAGVENQLIAVSDLKIGELREYRRERMGDAALFFENDTFSSLVLRFFERPEEAATATLLGSWLGKYADQYRYDQIYLLDAEGRIRLSEPKRLAALDATIALALRMVLRSGQTSFLDFYRDEEDGRVHLALLAPVRDGRAGFPPLGAVVLRIDPRSYFYPFISHWPTPSASAETLLFRREGNSVLYLNDLKFRADTALTLLVPLTEVAVPSIKAIRGEEGLVEGIDYRGVPVLAYIRAVPDSPWFLESQMDKTEAFAPLRERLALTVILLVAMILAETAILLLFWRGQKLRFYREKFETARALQETAAFLESLITYANSPILVWDPQFRITRLNHAFEALTGRSASELLGGSLEPLFPEEQEERSLRLLRETGSGGRWDAIEMEIRTAGGEIRTVLWSSAPIFASDGKTLVATIAQGQDITSLKEAEKSLVDQVEELRRWQSVMLGRESRVLELKWEVNELLSQAGQEPRYGQY